MQRTIILNATDVRVKELPNNADAMNNYTLKKKSDLLPYNGLFSNSIFISHYFSRFNTIQSYMFLLKMQSSSYMGPRALKVTEKCTA
jgi:hypothetical protein